MTHTEDILRVGFDSLIIPVALMLFRDEHYPQLAAELDQRNSALKAYITNGTYASIYENTNGDAVRIEALESKVTTAETLRHSIVLQTAHDIQLPDLNIRARIFIRAIDHDNGRAPDMDDVMRALSVIDAAGKLDHIRDVSPKQLKFVFNPETNDLIRYPDSRAVGFILEVNSALEKPEDVASIVTGPLAREQLMDQFQCSSQQLTDKLAKIRGDDPQFLTASDAQYDILEKVAARYSVVSQISQAKGREAQPRVRGQS